MFITVELLRENSACTNQAAAFEAEWPDGVTVDEQAVLRAFEIGLDVHWFASIFLTKPQWLAFIGAIVLHQLAYGEAIAPHLAVQRRADEQTRQALGPLSEEATQQDIDAYWDALDKHCLAFLQATAPYQKACEQAKATALVAAITKGE